MKTDRDMKFLLPEEYFCHNGSLAGFGSDFDLIAFSPKLYRMP